MTIDRLSELYLKGDYSKLDFYLGLIDVLSRTDDPDHVMEKVPGTLLNEVLEMAERHDSSAGEKLDHKQQENPDKILRWVRRHRPDLAMNNGNGAAHGARAQARTPHSRPTDPRANEVPLPSVREGVALEAIQRLEQNHGSAMIIARKLRDAVGERRIEEEVLAHHSRWCHSDGGFRESVKPARDAARAMYGFIPERLIETDESRTPDYDVLISKYRKQLAGGGTDAG